MVTVTHPLSMRDLVKGLFFWLVGFLVVGLLLNLALLLYEEKYTEQKVWCHTRTEGNAAVVLIIGDINAYQTIDHISEKPDTVFGSIASNTTDVCVFNFFASENRTSSLKSVLKPYTNVTLIVVENTFGDKFVGEYLDATGDSRQIRLVIVEDPLKHVPVSRSKVLYIGYWLSRFGMLRILSATKTLISFVNRRIPFVDTLVTQLQKNIPVSFESFELNLIKLYTPKYGKDFVMNRPTFWSDVKQQSNLSKNRKEYPNVNVVRFDQE